MMMMMIMAMFRQPMVQIQMVNLYLLRQISMKADYETLASI
jgi:hypothetical protein